MDSIDRSQNDTSERTSDKYVAKIDDINPVASGSYVKVNGDNHIPDQLFQNDEDTCSSTNSSSSHNLVIDQPEEANNNAEYECIDAGKKTNQKDSSTNSLKRKLSTYENGSPEYKQPHLTSCKPVTKLSPKYNSKQSQKMSMEYRSDNNESKRNVQLGETSEKRRKCGATVDINISRRVDNEDHFQEYAKYLRLKPTEKYKCFKCYNNSFETLAQLRGHQKVCLFKENHRHSSSQDGNSLDAYISSNSNPPFENASIIPTSEQIQARLEKQYIDTKTTAKAKKKVFLCAACGTYYENWNLFLHMREVHGRHICLYCVGMFPTAERLTLHLEMKHDLEQNHFESHEKLLQASRDTCYLMCCICEHIFTEHEDFQDHKCNKLVTPCALCGQKGRHSPNCKSSQSERSTKEKSKRKNKSSKEVGISEKSSGFAGIISQSVNDNSRLTADNIICDTRKTKSDNLNQWNFKMNGCVTETNVELPSDTFGIMESILSGRHTPEKMEAQIQPLNLSTLGYLDNIMENSNSIQQSTTSSFKDVMLSENSNQQYIQSIENEQNKDASVSNSFSYAIEQSERDLSSEIVEAKHYQGLTESSNENAIISTLNQDITVCENIASEESLSDVQSNDFKHPINTKIETPPSSTEVSQNEEKPLFVPKFKIKIPKEYQAPIDSEHSSTESDEEELEQSATGAEMTDDEIQDTLKESSAETSSFESKIEQEQQQESITEEDISKQEIDTEDKINVELTALNELNKMDIESPTDIAVQEETPADGIELANDDVLTIDLLLDRPIDRIPMVEFLRICLKSTYPICLYCNHARRISVNGHSLALHMIAQHKFAATVDSITAEELQPKTIVIKLKASLPDLIDIFFNMETYCNIEKEGLQPYEKIFECFLCRFETRIHKELYLHNRKMHLKTAILCFMCRANFFSYSEILCHMCPGMPNKCVIFDIKFRCCLCDIDQIPSAFRLMVHLRKKHFACDVCLEDCQDQSRLSSHVWKHKLHHLCYRCGIAYRNKPDITKHLFWKHGTESVLCKRCLQKRWPHVYHFCIPPPSFVCEVCNIAFSKAMFLKVHKRLHTGDAPYPCTEDNCDKKFISRKLLLKHVAQHTEEIEIKSIVEVKKENETKVDEKVEEVQQENVKEETTKKDTETNKKKRKKTKKEPPEDIGIDEIMNLPAPNLSESDSSEDSDGDKIKAEIQSPHVPTVMLSPPSDNGEDEKDVKPIIDIWENFKSFQASRNKNNNEDDIQDTDIIPITPILHVSQSDHDYCMMYKAIGKEVKTEKILDIITETKTELESSKVTDKTVILPKKKQKSPRKAPKSGSDSTSSGSSSGSDSSCSCGSNCSCSSSSGSSSNSSSSTENSNSSTSEGRRRIAVKRAAKVEKRNRNKSENSSKANTSDVVDVVTTDSKPHDTINFNSIILETDLETDESDTDEDFYDEHPQKLATQLLAEKRKQLMMQTCLSPSHNYDIVENSRPSTPSLPEEMMKEKKVKLKKKKREKKGSKSGTIPIFKLNIPNILGATPVSEDFEVELMKEVLAASPPYVSPPPSSIPPPPIFETTQNLASSVEQPQIQEIPPQNRTSTPIPAPIAPRNRLSTGSSSDADAPLKRSKRARRPNKFYGYSSDDDLIMPHIIGPAAFKPTPPPNLTWRKEDLPTPSKSVTAKSSKSPGNALKKTTPSSTPPLPPIPPIIIRPSAILQSRATSVIDPIIQKPPIVEPMRVPPVPVHHIQPPQYYPSSRESMESESSDEDKLHIPVPTQYNTQMQKQNNPIIAPIKTIISIPPAPIPAPTTQRIPPALLPNPDLARLQYFQRNNIRWPIRPPAGARPPREGESVYCYCRCPYDEVSEMIACDGDDCMIEWFHFECVGIMVPPKGKWFCPECRPKYPHEMSDSYENT